MHRYEKLDIIYAEHPEIKELVRAANGVIKAAMKTYPLTEETMKDSLDELKKAGKAVDNRYWLG